MRAFVTFTGSSGPQVLGDVRLAKAMEINMPLTFEFDVHESTYDSYISIVADVATEPLPSMVAMPLLHPRITYYGGDIVKHTVNYWTERPCVDIHERDEDGQLPFDEALQDNETFKEKLEDDDIACIALTKQAHWKHSQWSQASFCWWRGL